jgi:hypothetical protein
MAGRGGGLGQDQGISVYPFLFTAESRLVARASRRPVPFGELLGCRQVLLRVKITGSPPGNGSPS